MLDKVLVPLDGSPLATCVFPHLVAITRATEATEKGMQLWVEEKT